MNNRYRDYLVTKKLTCTVILFFSIILFSLIIRIYALSNIPAGFFADEASIGYNAYTILTKGTDQYNVPYPLFFKAFGDYKSPIQIYTSIIFVFLFGLNEFTVRMTSVLYGILSIAALYFLVKELFLHDKQKTLLALVSMFFLAISPWHIHISRISLEGMMAFVFFTTFGLYLFIKAHNKPRLLPFAIVSFALAMYSYFPARLFIPIFGIGIFLYSFRFFLLHIKETVISTIILIVFMIPFFQNLLAPEGLARWEQVNIFTTPPVNESVFHHIATNYLDHFSLDFLFLKGDIDMPGQVISRHSVRGVGELYLFQLPLFLLGLVSLIKRRNKLVFLLFLWLLLYPVGSMFTTDSNPFATRSIIGVIPFQIFSAIGFVYLFSFLLKRKKILYNGSLIIFIIIAGYSFIHFLSLYFRDYPNYSSDFWGWQYGPRDIISYFSLHEKEYDDLVMIPEFNAAEIFFKFYAPHTCNTCRLGTPSTLYSPNRKQLFALTPSYISSHANYSYKQVYIVYYPNGSIAFILTQVGQTITY